MSFYYVLVTVLVNVGLLIPMPEPVSSCYTVITFKAL